MRSTGTLIGFLLLAITPFAVEPIPAEESRIVKEAATSGDWPLFRGNALQTGTVVGELPDKLEVLWKFETKDSIESTAAISKGTVYIGSFDENLYAIDLASGKERWRYKAGPIKSAVSVQGDAVYVGDSDGMFHCVDAEKGTKRWKFETAAEIVSGANFAGDAILFGSYDETLYCLSKDGKERWKFKTQGPVNGSPAVVGGRTFVSGCDSSLHVIDTATGKELSSTELGSPSGATAAISGDSLYVGTMGNELLAIDWKKNSIAWSFKAEKRQQPFYSSAAVTDKLVLVGGRDKRVYALDRNTGKEVWSYLTRDKIDSSPVVVGQRVYVGSSDGNLYVLDLVNGTEIQKINLGGPITASPAVANGCLVIGTQNNVVYCLGAKRQG
jgi:outer membrane protein assembly factor BamB